MGNKYLLDTSETGVQHSVDIDHDGDGFYAIEHTPTRVENQILTDCARKRSLHQRKGSAFQHAAQIPILTHTMWKKEWREKYAQDFTWQTFLTMKLNSRENCHLRTGNKDGAFGKLL